MLIDNFDLHNHPQYKYTYSLLTLHKKLKQQCKFSWSQDQTMTIQVYISDRLQGNTGGHIQQRATHLVYPVNRFVMCNNYSP